MKSIPIRQLSCVEQIALNKHLRRSYTKQLDVENFLPFDFAMNRQKDEDEKKIKLENSATTPMEDDLASDSGKGTQRSGSSASVQTTGSSSSSLMSSSCKSEERKMKRKSKSSSSESSTNTEDSGVAKTAKKHLVNRFQSKLEQTPTVAIQRLLVEKPKSDEKVKKQQKVKELSTQKRGQYLKEKKCNLNVQSWKGKRSSLAATGEKGKVVRKEKC